jgi:hypothetical protein
MRETQSRYGKLALNFALHTAETILKQGRAELWDALDILEDEMPEHRAAKIVIEAVLGADAPPPDPVILGTQPEVGGTGDEGWLHRLVRVLEGPCG